MGFLMVHFYCVVSWTLTKQLVTKLQSAQRRMLRLIIGTPRRRQNNDNTTRISNNHGTADNTDTHSTDDVASTSSHIDLEPFIQLTDDELLEPWPDFMRRATNIAEDAIHKLGVEEWPIIYWKRKRRWTKRISQQDSNRWSQLVTRWEPEVNNPRKAARKQARPCKRWDDDINDFSHQHPTTTTDKFFFLEYMAEKFGIRRSTSSEAEARAPAPPTHPHRRDM